MHPIQAAELEAIARMAAELESHWRDGPCPFCMECLGKVVEKDDVELYGSDPARIGKREWDHKPDCPLDALTQRARRALEGT